MKRGVRQNKRKLSKDRYQLSATTTEYGHSTAYIISFTASFGIQGYKIL